MKDWLSRQRAQFLVNLGKVTWTQSDKHGERVATCDQDLPFHRVRDVLVSGRPALVCRVHNLPYDLFEDCMPFDRRGMTKRFLRQGVAVETAVHLDSAVCLSDWWFENYWHWLFEKLPKVVLAESTGFSGIYLVPPHPFCAESLSLMGIAQDRIRIHDGETLRIGELLLSPRIPGPNMLRHLDLLAQVRSRLMQTIVPSGSGRRFYLSRTKGKLNGRRVVNEDALQALAHRYGFEDYVGEGKSLAEQIADFAACEAALGPHGAAFANMLFAPQGTLTVELFSPLYVFHHIEAAIRMLGLRHYQVVADADLRRPTPRGLRKKLKQALNGKPLYPHGDGVMAELDVIETILLRELGQPA